MFLLQWRKIKNRSRCKILIYSGLLIYLVVPPELEKHDEIVRDVFLVGCFIAQRYEDYSRIIPDHVKTLPNGRKRIVMHTLKTKTKVVIPVNDKLDFILKKYNYKLPKTYEQKINKRIKEIAKTAGINESVEVQNIQGGLTYISHIPKFKLIKTHTARRTGATLMYYTPGMTTVDCMKITGHKEESQFLSYIKVSKDETANRVENTNFFKYNRLKIAE